jgi:hypothetical protein
MSVSRGSARAHRSSTTLVARVWLATAEDPSGRRLMALVHRQAPREGAQAPAWIPGPGDEHLVATPAETDPRRLSIADVVVRRALGERFPSSSLDDLRAHLPGCLVTAFLTGDCESLVGTATGWRALIATPAGPRTDGDVVCGASIVHAWLVAGRPLANLCGRTLVVGDCDEHGAMVRRRVLRIIPEHRWEARQRDLIAG